MTGDDVQTLLDTLPSHGGTVTLPSGTTVLTKPLRVRLTQTLLRGEGLSSYVTTSGFQGPAIVVSGNVNPFPTVPGCVTPQAFHLDRSANYRINLRDAGGVMELNGRSAFCVEGWVRQLSSQSDTYNVVGSNGQAYWGAPQARAFQINQRAGNRLEGILTVGGVRHAIQTPVNSLVTGTWYHFALTFDGSTVRFFLDGTLAGSAAASGTITHLPHEDVCVGTITAQWPEVTTMGAMAHADLDGLTFWKAARYTSAFTPPATLPQRTGETLVQFLGESWDCFTVGRYAHYADKCYFALRKMPAVLLGRVAVESLQVRGFFLCLDVYSSRFERLKVETQYRGMLCHGGFLNAYRDLDVLVFSDPISQYCAAWSVGGAHRFDGCSHFINGSYPVVFGGGSANLNGLWITPEPNTRASLLLTGRTGGRSPYTINHFLVDDENPGETGVKVATMILDDVSVIVNGGDIENLTGPNTNTPNVLALNCQGVAFQSVLFKNATGGPVVRFALPPAQSIAIRECRTFGAAWAAPEDLPNVVVTNSGSQRL